MGFSPRFTSFQPKPWPTVGVAGRDDAATPEAGRHPPVVVVVVVVVVVEDFAREVRNLGYFHGFRIFQCSFFFIFHFLFFFFFGFVKIFST